MTFAIKAKKQKTQSYLEWNCHICTISYPLVPEPGVKAEHSKKKHSLHHHFSKCSRVSQPRHWGDASFDLAHTILVDRASFFPSFNPDRVSFWRDDWRSVALSSLEVAPGVTPRVPALFDLLSSACRAAAPSDFPVRGKRGSPVQKFHFYFWVTARERDSHNRLGMDCFLLSLFPSSHLAATGNPLTHPYKRALYRGDLDLICQAPAVQTTEKETK